ncbi:MAG: hypothetical protein WC003_15470 [Terrimicrobiaceae bacterium]
MKNNPTKNPNGRKALLLFTLASCLSFPGMTANAGEIFTSDFSSGVIDGTPNTDEILFGKVKLEAGK